MKNKREVKTIEIRLRGSEDTSKPKFKRRAIKVLPRHKGRLIAIVAISASLGACGGFHASMCTTEGCRARNDYTTGVISESHFAPKGLKSSHYQMREKQEDRETIFESIKGLFGSNGQ